jgi:hypothetical protein
LHNKASAGFIIAPNGFSGNAVEWAKGKPITLVDIEKLVELAEKAYLENQLDTKSKDLDPKFLAIAKAIKSLDSEIKNNHGKYNLYPEGCDLWNHLDRMRNMGAIPQIP